MHQKNNTILIIEDARAIRKVLTISLEAVGYKVVSCDNGREGVRLVASVGPDLVILDLSLPDINGKEVIKGVREWSRVPIIVCSAHDTDQIIIEALEAGADDYITKPFSPDIVLAHIHANLRNATTVEVGEPELINGHIRMDLVRHEVYLNAHKTRFTPKEYELLRYFVVNRGKMLTHRDILKAVWGITHAARIQYVRVYVNQLREKIESNAASPSCIVTQPGIGYRMEAVQEPAERQPAAA